MKDAERIEINNFAVSIMEDSLYPKERFSAAKRIYDLTKDPRPDWTPCAEGLPEESKIYSVIAVYYQNGSIKDVMDNLWYYGNGEWQKYDDLCKVIAWKPYNPDRKEDADHIVDANKKIEED